MLETLYQVANTGPYHIHLRAAMHQGRYTTRPSRNKVVTQFRALSRPLSRAVTSGERGWVYCNGSRELEGCGCVHQGPVRPLCRLGRPRARAVSSCERGREECAGSSVGDRRGAHAPVTAAMGVVCSSPSREPEALAAGVAGSEAGPAATGLALGTEKNGACIPIRPWWPRPGAGSGLHPCRRSWFVNRRCRGPVEKRPC